MAGLFNELNVLAHLESNLCKTEHFPAGCKSFNEEDFALISMKANNIHINPISAIFQPLLIARHIIVIY